MSTPALIIPSKYVNGTNTEIMKLLGVIMSTFYLHATAVSTIPLIIIPFLKFPFESTSPKICYK